MPDDKSRLRELAASHRRAQANQDEASRAICLRLASLSLFQAARCVLLYVDAGSEVRTQPFLPVAMEQKEKIVVPYCVDDSLELFHLEDMAELTVGRFRIREPRPELRTRPDKRVGVEEIDLAVTPGVAFDRRGGRLGHGHGYYDRLLKRVRADAPLVALAFECQLFDALPLEPHDVCMDWVITETAIYSGRGRQRT